MENDQNHPVPFGKYQILEELGRGGFGIVYHAFDTVLEREVAIKELYPNLVNDPAFVSRFKQEARITAKLDHPNLVPVYDFGQIDGKYYLAMGYMPGGSLKDLLKQEGPLSKERALKIIQQVGAGLAYAYDQGVIHRDLKPGNILFDAKGQARVSDLGFAKLLHSKSSSSMSTSGGLVGTPSYMAPEIWRGKGASAATDVYSLVCILVEMLTARSLFDGESTPEIMFKHFEPLQLPEDLPEEWIPIIEQGLEKKPEERTADIADFISQLQLAKSMRAVIVKTARDNKKLRTESQGEPIIGAELQRDPDSTVQEKQLNDEPLSHLRKDDLIPDQPKGEIKRSEIQSTEPLVFEMQRSRSRDSKAKLNSLMGKLPVFLGLTVAVIIAIYVIVSNGTFSAKHESTIESLVLLIQETSTQMPIPTQINTLSPTETSISTNTSVSTKTESLTPRPGLTWTPTPTPDNFVTEVRKKDDMEMVFVPEGTFEMGSTSSSEETGPVRKVYLDAFWIDKYEVTNKQYQQCVSEGACDDPNDASSFTRSDYYYDPMYENYPVINIKWYQAYNYCLWVGGHLPSEAQWEKSARGSDGRLYPWGNGFPNRNLANYYWNRNDTTEVGSYPKGVSPYGAMDMTGNVWEWVWDWYGEYDPYDTYNPLKDSNGSERVLRGGGFDDALTGGIRAFDRGYSNPNYAMSTVGFRCVSPP